MKSQRKAPRFVTWWEHSPEDWTFIANVAAPAVTQQFKSKFGRLNIERRFESMALTIHPPLWMNGVINSYTSSVSSTWKLLKGSALNDSGGLNVCRRRFLSVMATKLSAALFVLQCVSVSVTNGTHIRSTICSWELLKLCLATLSAAFVSSTTKKL